MIFFDTGKSLRARHRSGLTRVTLRLAGEFGPAATPCGLTGAGERFEAAARKLPLQPGDWLLTAGLFSERECPGLWNFIAARRCRLAAIFHDAIPLRHPHITWPQSVARHPEYMKMLAGFDRVFAVSDTSRRELVDFWKWQEVAVRASVELVALGADFASQPRIRAGVEARPAGLPSLLCVGILEPRKNQAFLLDVCDALWAGGLKFTLNLVGRVNPHFGAPVLAKIKKLGEKWPYLKYHDAADDRVLARLYREARVTVFPTIAEGCGLPLLESLWAGVPCVCSDLPVLRENAEGGGCVAVPLNDQASWERALARVLTEEGWVDSLRQQAVARQLPTWAETAVLLRTRMS